jgi:hypothetical protein
LAFCSAGAVTLDILLKPRPPAAPSRPAAQSAAPPLKWLDDWQTAQAIAKAEGKDILLQLTLPVSSGSKGAATATGSATLLESTTFLRPISASFVLLRVSVSHDMPADQIARTRAWAMRAAVTRFPTFVLLDSDGTAYAQSEFAAKGAIAYWSELKRLRKVRRRRDRELALAAAATGIARARHLDAVLTAVGPLGDTDYAALQQQVIDLDPQNTTGLRAKYESAITHRKIDRTVQDEVYPLIDRGQYMAGIARLAWLMADVNSSRDPLQLLLAFKGQVSYRLKEQLMSAKLLAASIAMAPNGESAHRAAAAREVALGPSLRQPRKRLTRE